MTDRPEPHTHAGKALHKGEVFDLTVAEDRRRLAIAIEAEAEGAAPRAEGPTDPIDGPVEWLAQAYMDLCNRVDEPFSATLIDEARRTVAAPRAEGLDPERVKRALLESGRFAGGEVAIAQLIEAASPVEGDPHRDYAGRTCTTGLLHSHSEGAAPRAEGLDPLDALSAIDEKLYQWEVECRTKGVWRESDPDARMTRWIRAVIEPFLSRPSDEAPR